MRGKITKLYKIVLWKGGSVEDKFQKMKDPRKCGFSVGCIRVTFNTDDFDSCTNCQGSGQITNLENEIVRCPICQGIGVVQKYYDEKLGFLI